MWPKLFEVGFLPSLFYHLYGDKKSASDGTKYIKYVDTLSMKCCRYGWDIEAGIKRYQNKVRCTIVHNLEDLLYIYISLLVFSIL